MTLPDSIAEGELRTRLRQVTSRAQESGILEPIDTREIEIAEAGLTFAVRIATAPPSKSRDGETPGRNPFLPPDPDLLVGGLTSDYLAVLNRYPVLDEHLLLVTRDFRSQVDPLRADDFLAWALALAEYPGLGFYNSGRKAGASQPHKHLQFVPLPIGSGKSAFPLESRFENGALPFPHHRVSLGPAFRSSPRDWSLVAHGGYREGLKILGLRESRSPSDDLSIIDPYNLVITREWLLIVPRRAESHDGISVNGLGFAGSLFVNDQDAIQRLREIGPLTLLRLVTFPSG